MCDDELVDGMELRSAASAHHQGTVKIIEKWSA